MKWSFIGIIEWKNVLIAYYSFSFSKMSFKNYEEDYIDLKGSIERKIGSIGNMVSGNYRTSSISKQETFYIIPASNPLIK